MTWEINWLAVVVAAAVTFVLGGVWYGPLFGRVWHTAEGAAEPQPGRQDILRLSTGCRLC
jgi:hypothetical protein